MVVSPEQHARRRMGQSRKTIPFIRGMPSRRVLKASPKKMYFSCFGMVLVLFFLLEYHDPLRSGSFQLMEDASRASTKKEGSNNNNNNSTRTDKPKSKSEMKREMIVEALSVIYRASNSTHWCQSMDDHYSKIHDQIPTFNDEEASMKTHKKFETMLPHTGMYLVKVPKAGSSTSAAVSLQIAEAIGEQKGFDHPCPHHIHHGHAYDSRESPNFLWSAVRKPHLRSISSYFFFKISRGGNEYNSTKLIQYLDREKNFQLNYLTKGKWKKGKSRAKPKGNGVQIPQKLDRVYEIFGQYDFIAVAERMEESLVVLKLLFGFPDEAMIVFSSKRAGGFDDGANQHKCARVQKAETTLDVDMHIGKDTNYHKENLDFFLYEAAERSLDRTIEFLGKDLVAQEVEYHRKLQAYAEAKCLEHVVFPCEEDGARPNPESLRHCYFGDLGCGHECAMNAVREYKELLLPPSVSLFFNNNNNNNGGTKNLRASSDDEPTEPLPLPK